MAIQVLKPRYHVEECLEEIRECLSIGWTGVGFKTVAFENAWKDYTGLPNAHFTNSATSGLHLAVNILKKKHGWSDGDEVITTPLTFISTNHVILYERLAPKFADVDDSLCLSPESIEETITPRTRAVMYVGMGGSSGRLHDVREVCERHGLSLILDAAHMAGTKYFGKHVGSEGDVAVFSFHSVKNLPTADSGMACFRENDDDELARQLSWMGITKDTYQRTNEGSYRWRYEVADVGFKYHGNSVMAAIALVQLRHLEEDNSYRRQLARQYRETFDENPNITLVPESEGCIGSNHLFQIRVRDRDRVIQELYTRDIYPGVHYADNTEYPMYRSALGSCPNALRISKEIISLPLHLDLTSEDINYVCEAVEQAAGVRET